jgi:hypothetical protein
LEREVLIVISILVGAGAAVAWERRERAREKAKAAEEAGRPIVESVVRLDLEPGKRYRVVKAFMDHDRATHPEGEEWTFLRSAFVPYHSGVSWFVSFDGREETHIRLQGIPEEQGHVLDNPAQYLVEV